LLMESLEVQGGGMFGKSNQFFKSNQKFDQSNRQIYQIKLKVG